MTDSTVGALSGSSATAIAAADRMYLDVGPGADGFIDGTHLKAVMAAQAPVQSVATRTGAVTLAVADVSGAAPLASPTFTGTMTMPDGSTWSVTGVSIGPAPSATPATQTINIGQSALAGHSNVGGGDVTINGTQSTGNQFGGNINFYTHHDQVPASGSSLNPLEKTFVITGSGNGVYIPIANAPVTPGIGVLINGDSYNRIALGLDSGTPFFGFGPGSGPRDVFMWRSATGALSVGATASSQDGVFKAGSLFTNEAANIGHSSVTVTGGTPSSAPTFSPAPSKWLPYDDNGTTRYVPSWV